MTSSRVAGGEEVAIIREQISSAIDLIVQTERIRGGARRIVSIVELMGIDEGEIRYQEVFTYRQVGVAENGASRGYHTATGVKSLTGW